MSKKEATSGKLIFSNPAHPDSAYTPEMKSLGEVDSFASHVPATQASVNRSQLPQVAVYTAPPDVTVTPSNPLVISGSGPVEANFGTVTIEPGGQILVYTAASINIEKLVKK